MTSQGPTRNQTLDASAPYAHAGFDGRICLITGGTQGLGFATAALMAARGAAGIVIVGRDRAKAERAAADLSTTACRVVAVSEDLAVQGAADDR